LAPRTRREIGSYFTDDAVVDLGAPPKGARR
jgi:hypothetical protein